MGIFDSWLQAFGKRKEYETQGMLRAQQAQRGQRGGMEILGQRPQPEQIGELGRFGVQLQPSQEGTGYSGGKLSQLEARTGLVNEGYNPQEITSMLGNIPTPQQPTAFSRNFAEYGAASPETQQQMLQFKRAGGTNINMGGAGTLWTQEQVKSAGLPQGAVVTEDRYGKPQILRAEKYTQPQILSGGFATRMSTANDDLTRIMSTGFDPSGVVQNVDMFGMPDVFANYLRTPEGQQYRQAQENWITANLRKESGAAIPPEETEREIKKWFPQPGDSTSVIAQKARARKDAQRAMQKSAGGAYQELEDQAERDRLSELRVKHGIK